MPANKGTIANFSQYSEVINANQELEITARQGAQNLRQTLVANPPCVVFYDPTNLSFFAVSLNGTSWNPSWQFVSVVSSIT